MKERGITNNAYYFTKELDSNVKVVFNLNKEESRIFTISSLYETSSSNPIEITIVHNNFGKYANDTFGSAAKLSYYRKLEYTTNDNVYCILVTYADLKEVYYYKDTSYYDDAYYRYLSFDEKNTILVSKTNANLCEIIDTENNKYFYNLSINPYFPYAIKLYNSLSSGNDYTFTFDSTSKKIISIENNCGDKVTFVYSTTYTDYVSTVNIYRLNESNVYAQTYRIDCTYDYNELTSAKLVSLKTQSGNYITAFEYQYLWNSNKTTRIIKDVFSTRRIEYEGNSIRKYLYENDTKYKQYTFTKYDCYTKVTNNFNARVIYYFYKYDKSILYSCDEYLNTTYQVLNQYGDTIYASSKIPNSKTYIVANKDNLVLNSNFDSLNNWNFSEDATCELVSVSNENVFSAYLGNKYITLDGDINSYMYQNISVNGKANEKYIINAWVFSNDVNLTKLENATSDYSLCKIEIVISNSNTVLTTKTLEFNLYELLNIAYKSLSIEMDSDFDNIEIKVYKMANEFISIKAISLFKDQEYINIEYNTNNKINNINNKASLVYNENNKLIEQMDNKGRFSVYKRDSNNNIIKTINSGVIKENTYNEKRKTTSEKIIGLDNKYIESLNIFNESNVSALNGLILTQSVSSDEITETYTNDLKYLNVLSQSNLNGSKTYNYDHPFSLLSKIVDVHDKTNNILYEYYNEYCAYNGAIKYVTLENNVKYKFEYNLYGDIEKISVINLNDNSEIVLFTYAYELNNNVYTGNISYIYFGTSNSINYINYTYDDYGRINAIIVGDKNYYFTYDQHDLLRSVLLNNTYQINYTYTINDLIKDIKYYEINNSINILIYTINYFYNEDLEYISKEIIFSDKKYTYINSQNSVIKDKTDIYEELMYSNGTKMLELDEAKLNRNYVCSFEESSTLRYKAILKDGTLYEHTISPIVSNNSNISSEGNIKKYLINSYNDAIAIRLYNEQDVIDYDTTLSDFNLMFYFKMENNNTNNYLMFLGSGTENTIALKINSSNQLILEMTTYDELVSSYVLFDNIPLNQWNFIGISAFSLGTFRSAFNIILNDKTYTKIINTSSETYQNIITIGGKRTSSGTSTTGYLTNTYISSLVMGKNDYSIIKMQEVKQKLDECLYDQNYIDNNSELGYLKTYTSTTRLDVNSTLSNGEYDIYLLNDSLKSINGNTLYSSNNNILKYSKTLKRKVCRRNEKDLVYAKPSINISYNFSFAFKIKTISSSGDYYVFYLKESASSDNFVGIKFKKDYQAFYFQVNDTEYYLEDFINSNWSEINLCISDQDSYYMMVFWVDGVKYSYNVWKTEFILSNDILLYIGSNPTLQNGLVCEFETLLFLNKFLTNENNLSTNVIKEIITNYTNSLGLLKSKELNVNNVSLVKNNLTYKEENNKIIPVVVNENIKYGNITDNYEYALYNDNKLYIVYKNGQIKNGFIYNKRGYLVDENINNEIEAIYEYDENGNILSKKHININTSELLESHTFTYDTIFKDRLIKYDNDVITYSSTSPGYIYSVTKNNKTCYFTYKGNRLTQITNNDDFNYQYEYNEKGQRTKKYKNGVLYKSYYYDNDLLIKEVKSAVEEESGHTIYYLYDANNMLYGFILNNTRYYYIRDCYGLILGIVNSSGTLIVEYVYDGYGNIKQIIQNNTDVGNINPFRYKGYYYDVETGYYYCNSRYYNPEWCRWVSPDPIEYLDPESVNGLNLYCYCYNNPIIYKDSSGCYPMLTNILGVLLSESSKLVGNVNIKHANKYLKKQLSIQDAQKIISKRKINIKARQLIRDKYDEALNYLELGKTLKKVGNFIDNGLILLEVGTIIYKNCSSGSDTWVSEATVDFAYLLLQNGISALCTVLIPGVGWLVGIGANLLIDYLFENNELIDDAKSWLSQYDDEIKYGLLGKIVFGDKI